MGKCGYLGCKKYLFKAREQSNITQWLHEPEGLDIEKYMKDNMFFKKIHWRFNKKADIDSIYVYEDTYTLNDYAIEAREDIEYWYPQFQYYKEPERTFVHKPIYTTFIIDDDRWDWSIRDIDPEYKQAIRDAVLTDDWADIDLSDVDLRGIDLSKIPLNKFYLPSLLDLNEIEGADTSDDEATWPPSLI